MTLRGGALGKSYKGDPIAQSIIPQLPRLLKHAQLVWQEEPKRGEGFKSVARLVARIKGDFGERDVWMVVRRDSKGNRNYNHTHSAAAAVGKPLRTYALGMPVVCKCRER